MTTRIRTVRVLLAVIAASVVLVACAGSGDGAGAPTTSTTPSPTTTPVSTPATLPETTAPDTTAPETTATPTAYSTSFELVTPGGDCACADGGTFSFFVRTADPTKVLFFFQGGGACFSAETCSFTNGTYKVGANAMDDPSNGDGIFALSDERNPFHDFSIVFVPYCTGDVFLGNAITKYSNDLSVHHKGYVNGNAALDELVHRFPNATQVVVAGESAGAIPTPLFAGLVHDQLPAARLTVLADGSGAYPDAPAFNAAIGTLWGTQNAVPDWPENADVTAENWSIPGLFVRAGAHAPQITFARHDYAFDPVQTFFMSVSGVPSQDLLSMMAANEKQIEASGVDLLSYTAPGSAHTVLSSAGFYEETVEGVSLLDWVSALVAGDVVTDVTCVDCGP
jgi:Pectinacetylesterase